MGFVISHGDLRRRAEERVGRAVAASGDRVLYELEIHQIQLELQNDELRRLRGELDEAGAAYRDLLDHVPVGLVTLDASGRIVDVNRTATRMLGVERGALVGRPLAARVADDDVDRFLRHRVEVAAGRASTIELELLDARGARRAFVLESTPVPAGGAAGCRTAIVDVGDAAARAAEARRAEDAELHRRFHQVTGAISEVFYVVDAATGRVRYASPAAATVLGRTAAELVVAAHGWLDLIHPDDAIRVATAMEQRREGAGLDEEYRLVRPDGTTRIVRDRGLPVEADGRCAGLLRDVSDERAIEQQLLQIHRLDSIGALTAGISHDFNNLLSVVGALVERAQDCLDPGGEADTYLEHAHAALTHGRRLASELVGLARNRPTDQRPVRVDDVVERAAALLRPLLGARIELVVVLGAGARRALIDPVELEQVVLNLATNARDAMPDGGELTIATRAVAQPADRARELDLPARAIVLEVRDTGVGMDEATRARVFEPFFTTKPIGRGTGLGLATSQAILRRSGGRVAVESAPGAGTTFTIHLPECDPPDLDVAAPAAPVPWAPTRGGPTPDAITVLIVEDDAGSRLAMTEHLTALGYHVLAADRPSEALALATDQPIDLLVTDYGLPEMTGSALAGRLRLRHPALHVLVLSGYPESDLPPEGGFLQKPFGLDDLARAVAAMVGAPVPR